VAESHLPGRNFPKSWKHSTKTASTRIVTVATNGAYADRVRDYVEYLTENCPGIQLRIQVSIDNLFEKHDLNRGSQGLFDRLIQTCQVVGELKATGRRVMLSIGVVLTPYNRNDLRDLRRFLDESFTYDDVSLIFPRGNAKDHSMKEVTWREYREAKEVFEVIKTPPNTFARLYQAIDRQSKEGIAHYLEKGPVGYPWTCVAGKKMITLTEKGLLTPCEMLCQLHPDLDSSLGNVRDFDYDVLAMLAANKATRLRELIESTHCSCSYECAAACNVVFHKKEWPSLLSKLLWPGSSRG
jgi:MoaA/NifB/PqqE/SkfB family radical SAM enzyme